MRSVMASVPLTIEAIEQRQEESYDYTSLMDSNTAAKQLLEFANDRLNMFCNPKLYKALQSANSLTKTARHLPLVAPWHQLTPQVALQALELPCSPRTQTLAQLLRYQRTSRRRVKRATASLP